jgi:hypothetical protein
MAEFYFDFAHIESSFAAVSQFLNNGFFPK